MPAVQVLLLLVAPAATIALARRSRAARGLGLVFLCYGLGILLANLRVLPLQREVSERTAEVALALAMPLLLFPVDLLALRSMARPLLASFAIAAGASYLSGLLFGYLALGYLPEAAKIAGMLVGSYIGGSPNLTALGLALEVPRELFFAVNAAEVMTGGLWILFMLALLPRLLRAVLGPFQTSHDDGGLPGDDPEQQDAFFWPGLRSALAVFGVSVAVVGIGAGAVFAMYRSLPTVPILLALTSLGIAGSFSPRLRGLRGAAMMGEYGLLVLCVSIGSLVNLEGVATSSPKLLVLCLAVMTLATAVHLAAARLMRLSPDVVLVTSAAAILGPAFIPAVGRGNVSREIIAAGIALGLAGFAVGTYAGLSAAWLLS